MEARFARSSSEVLARSRYSVGAWQRTEMSYSSISSRRSAGSKPPSWKKISVPWLHGPRKTFQMLLAQPVPEVHHNLSPSWRSSQYFASIHLECVYPWVCRTPLGCLVVPDVYRMNAP